MRRNPGLAFTVSTVLLWSFFLYCLPLAAQRRPNSTPFPDDDAGLSPSRGHSFSISGMVSDAESHERIDGVRVDLQGLSGGILATEFTGSSGNFEFTNVRLGSYQLVFQQVGYQDSRQEVEVQGPVFAMNVALRRLNSGGPGGSSVSVRELSMPQKARDAMSKGISLLYDKSDYAGSIKQFERAIQAYPNFYEAYAQMGVAYMKMKDTARSEQALRKSLDLSENRYPDALFILAALFSNEKRYADAEPLARKAVELDANSWHAQSELAQALIGLKRPEEAEKYAQAAVKLQPDNALLRLLLADIHIALGNDPALLDDFNAYLKLAPNGSFAERVRQHRDELQQRLQNSQASPSDPSPSASQANP
jgi:tetratricopeptide (TPR) repeat protein